MELFPTKILTGVLEEIEDNRSVGGHKISPVYCSNIGLNYPKMSAQEVERRKIESRTLLLFVLSVRQCQARRGGTSFTSILCPPRGK